MCDVIKNNCFSYPITFVEFGVKNSYTSINLEKKKRPVIGVLITSVNKICTFIGFNRFGHCTAIPV